MSVTVISSMHGIKLALSAVVGSRKTNIYGRNMAVIPSVHEITST